MRWMVVLLLVVILGSLGLVAEPFAPVATLHSPPSVIGRDTVLHPGVLQLPTSCRVRRRAPCS